MADASHPEIVAARRAIALGKLRAFDDECHRLAELVDHNVLTVTDVIDVLAEADIAHDLSATFGVELVQTIMQDAFARGTYGVARQEAA